jgi:hypothetical protein
MQEDPCVHDGTCYPTNHLCAAFTDDADALRAVADLQSAGFTDLERFHGVETYEALQQRRRQQPIILRVWRDMRNVGGEGDLHRLYLNALRNGGSFIIVAPELSGRKEEATTILAAHHASSIWYMGTWAMERLPATTSK